MKRICTIALLILLQSITCLAPAIAQSTQPNCEGRSSVEAATQAIQQSPKDKNELAAMYACRGEAYEVAGDSAKAIADYTQAIKLAPRNGWHYRARGLVYLAGAAYARAIADFGSAIRFAKANSPLQITAYVGRATAYYAQNRYDLCIRDASQVIKVDAGIAEAYRLRGLAQREKGKFDLALDDFAKALQLNPADSRIWANRARLYATRGQFDLAVSDWNESLRLKPDAESFYYRGSAQLDLNNYAAAISDFTQAIALRPPFVDAVRLRGQAFAFKGDYAAAIADFDQFIGPEPSAVGDAFAYYLRGLSHSRLGHKDQATRDLRRAAQLTSDAELQQKIKDELAVLS
jgi:tetratricopeptide (TPR) repeat protein